MLKGKTLDIYAELIIKKGVNLQNGQGLEIVCPVELPFVAEALTKKAYELGASIVSVRWESEKIDRLNFENASIDKLTFVPKWLIDSRNYLVKENFCYIAIASENPKAFVGVDANKISAYSRAKSKALKDYSDAVMKNKIRWCVVSYPTLEWANEVFSNDENSVDKLSLAIEKAMRLNGKNTIADWEKHVDNLNAHANVLTKKQFEYLHFKNSLGTDLKVGLADHHVWLSALETGADGVPFIANLPTEEVFTAPHKNKVDGVVRSSLPLIYNGVIIDDFSLSFKNGKIVSFTASKGYDTLKELIETDSGTKRIGEVALIGKNSPIAKSGVLFLNTLFDENASCHIALGKAYPTCVEGGDKLSKTELANKGLNDSIEHVDFMLGTKDLTVTGIDKFGKTTPVFIDGEWAI